MADAADLKSATHRVWGFESLPGHQLRRGGDPEQLSFLGVQETGRYQR